MSTAVLDIQKAKIAGIQEFISSITRNNPDAPCRYFSVDPSDPAGYHYGGCAGTRVH